jgi:putative transposase
MRGKKVKGRKRHIVVDVRGTVTGIRTHAANIQDAEGAEYALRAVLTTDCTRLARIVADKGYRSEDLATWVAEVLQVPLEVVGGVPGQKGFAVHKWRWIVERTLAWLSRHRRLAKDVERLAETTEAFACLAMVHLLLKRLYP